MDTIVVASANKHKIEEIASVTGNLGFHLISRDDAGVPADFEIVEDGETFEENSYIKAKAIMDICGKPTIADDSGLMVEALGGAPGVYSARFAGEDHNDKRNNEKLIDLLAHIPYKERRAKFVAVITLLFPDGRKVVARGECPGHIIDQEEGTNGFGYDPLFVPEGYGSTFGMLNPEVKNQISHRARALKLLAEKIGSMRLESAISEED
ncbi:MAG: RdgB/HAM1 family non-canonical purine NTP pyrophosphatase [Clostridiales bacterium]|nr:RdgB/HAM1 family non-canonical purine NTP pyrophosphatase [Clostridiales bacterium]MDD7347982.1 RdgB/HAM1 family non-canonical purine NTP pyrophosphatase [Clostridiales bacterium]MDY4060543.1 RdgB/HAM1 family non-canonical purine NTP pyrophosphatase [Anaerovoracaceae bacterium]